MTDFPDVIVLVCGSRGVTAREFLGTTFLLDGLLAEYPGLEIVHGAARGADSLAGEWARRAEVPEHPRPADWDAHGRGAGPIRNQAMLDEFDVAIVVACLDRPLTESRGTADMVRRARAAGLPVHLTRTF